MYRLNGKLAIWKNPEHSKCLRMGNYQAPTNYPKALFSYEKPSKKVSRVAINPIG